MKQYQYIAQGASYVCKERQCLLRYEEAGAEEPLVAALLWKSDSLEIEEPSGKSAWPGHGALRVGFQLSS